MGRPRMRVLVAGLAIAAVAFGAAACDDDDDGGATDAGGSGDESALAVFCNDLASLDTVVGEFSSLDPATTMQDDLAELSIRLGSATDSLGLSTQGAGIDTDALGGSLASFQTTLQDASGSEPTEGSVTAIQEEAGGVSDEIDATEDEYCSDEPAATEGG